MKMSESFIGRKIVYNDLNRQRKQVDTCPPTGGSPSPYRQQSSLALGRWDLSYLTETGIVQYTNVPVHILVTHSNQKEV